MCGRYTLTRHDKIVEDLEATLEVSAAEDPWWKPRFNVAPTQPAPVVIRRSDDGDGGGDPGTRRSIAMMRWGLLPHWAGRAGTKPPLMINARLESLAAKQVFRDALARKRCLVPADGFFEWVAQAGRGKPPPRPFYFHPRTVRLFAFAGLWARTRDDRGNEIRSFTIVTTRANDLVRPIHDRMPIVLAPEHHAAWLDPAIDADHARALLQATAGSAFAPPDAPDAETWVREAVSTWVNKADHDDPQCLAPAPPELFAE